MTDLFDLKAPLATALSATVYADGVRLSFGENIANTEEVTYHTAVFIPASIFSEFKKLVSNIEPKLAEMKNAVQN